MTYKKSFYRSRTTHLIPKGAALFITFRLQDSIPDYLARKHEADYIKAANTIKAMHTKDDVIQTRLARLKASFFEKYEALLEKDSHGRCWLKDPFIAGIVKNKLHELDGKMYRLLCYCIMPNHVHMLIDLSGGLSYADPLRAQIPKNEIGYYPKIMNLVKGSTAYHINRYLGQKGKFWQRDSYSRYIRNEKHLFRVISYTLNNPFKAGICSPNEKFPHNYMAQELIPWFHTYAKKHPNQAHRTPW